MLIRVRGYTGGIKEYLEDGQKKGREMERDEMDERVILAGDLTLTNDIIESIDTDAERYLSITMSFKEDYIDRKLLEQIVAEFEEFAFAAYEPGEYVFYAEAHLARIKAYANRKTGELVERKPHLHIVIPKYNLLRGQRRDPFELVNNQNRYIDAFQEPINNKCGLASPKNNRRVDFTDASEMISRYKGDVFEGANSEAKAKILAAVMDRGISDYDAFKAMLAELGDTRTRNAGRSNEYENVKLPDSPRGINLKEYVFSREFIALSSEAKQAALTEKYMPQYEETGEPRPTPEHMLATLQQWHERAAKEVKYINGAFRATYRAASAEERQSILAERERNFYQRFDNEGPNGNRQEPTQERMGRGDRGRRRADSHAGGRDTSERRAAERGRGSAQDEEAPQYGPEWDAEHDLAEDRLWAQTESGDRLRDMSSIGMDGITERGEMLLPDPARLQLDQHRPTPTNALRWRGSGRGAVSGGISHDWRYLLAAEYEAYARSTAAERRQAHAESAGRLNRHYDRLKGGGRLPREFGGSAVPPQLNRIPSLAATPLLHTGKPTPRRGRGHHMSAEHAERLAGQYDRSKTGARLQHGRNGIDAPRTLQSVGRVPRGRAIDGMTLRRRAARPRNTATGREADSLLSQLARDREESARTRDGGRRSEFDEIRHELDATRLLDALAHSHGVIPEKYQITRGRDGADRVKVGSRHLNVTDFLTKELNLPWSDAAQILRKTFQEQVHNDPEYLARKAPQQGLWREYQAFRMSEIRGYRSAWLAQGESERVRKAEIRELYLKKRSAIQDNPTLKPSQKKSQLSIARMERVQSEAELRSTVDRERTALKTRSRIPLDDHYREFLKAKAQDGDERALHELRRLQRTARTEHDPTVPIISPARKDEQNEIIYHGPLIQHTVHRNGDVTYSKNGVAILDDEGRSLRMWESDSDSIELGLRLAATKFGSTLTLTGPDDFQRRAARMAAEAGMRVTFSENSLNDIMLERKAELDAERRAASSQERSAAIRQPGTDAAPPSQHQAEQRADQEKGEEPGIDIDR